MAQLATVKKYPASLEVVNNFGVRTTVPTWFLNMMMPVKYASHIIIDELYTHNPQSETDHVLITRYRGGLGDQICMIPAIEGLLAKHGNKLHLAVPKPYFPLYENVGIKTDMIDTMVEENNGGYYRFRQRFREVYDMYCPAALYERSVDYDVRNSRVENFCEHCHVPVKTPKIKPAIGKDYFSGLKRPIIGLAPRAASWLKEWPISRMVALAQRFQKRGWTPVCFDNKFVFDSIPSMSGLNIRELGTALSQLDYMVAIDSGIMHYALAVGVPTLGLFGATSGYHTMRVYAKGKFIQSFLSDSCLRPCYYSDFRNYYCGKGSGAKPAQGGIRRGKYSTCMKEISVESVDAMVCQELEEQ